MAGSRISTIVALGFVALCVSVAAEAEAAQDELAQARSLYASADYEGALSALGRMHENDRSPELAGQIDRYRLYCLVALDHTGEAESVAADLLRREPLAQMDASEASPRIEAVVTNVRKRLLPALIRERYRAALTAVELKDVASAGSRLNEVRRMIDAAASLGASNQGLEDLGLAVDGLLDLTRAASDTLAARTSSTGPLAAVAPPESTPVPQPPAASRAWPDADSRVGTAGDSQSGPVALDASDGLGSGARIYTSADVDVVAPVALVQNAPSAARSQMLAEILSSIGRKSGEISVTIDEQGNVEDAVMNAPVHPIYDRSLLSMARRWKYRPAMKGSVPVRYRKTIRIEVQ